MPVLWVPVQQEGDEMKPQRMKLRSLLYDNIYGYNRQHVVSKSGGVYYKKPAYAVSFVRKLAWCFEILRGYAVAVHFHEDEERAACRG